MRILILLALLLWPLQSLAGTVIFTDHPWTDADAIVYLTNQSDDLCVGGSDPNTAAFFLDASTGVIKGNQPGGGTDFAAHATAGGVDCIKEGTEDGSEMGCHAVPDSGLNVSTTVYYDPNGGLDVQTGRVTAAEYHVTSTQTVCQDLFAHDIICTDGVLGCDPNTLVDPNYTLEVAEFPNDPNNEKIFEGVWNFTVPANIAGTTFTARIYWMDQDVGCNSDGAVDSVCWVVSAKGVGDKEWIHAAFGASQGVQDNCALWDRQLISPVTDAITHGWAAGDSGFIKLGRDTAASHADCGFDLYTGTARFMRLQYCYEVNNAFSGE